MLDFDHRLNWEGLVNIQILTSFAEYCGPAAVALEAAEKEATMTFHNYSDLYDWFYFKCWIEVFGFD